MKKFLALLLALTMALALVACGGGDDAASDTTADSGDDAAASTGEFEEMTWKFACSATETSPWVWTAPRSSPGSWARRPAVPSPFSTIPLTS